MFLNYTRKTLINISHNRCQSKQGIKREAQLLITFSYSSSLVGAYEQRWVTLKVLITNMVCMRVLEAHYAEE